jgi:hypothetical protein
VTVGARFRLETAALSGGALTLAAAADFGGFVSGRTPLPTMSTVRGRYVLIWFTRLPRPRPSGTYQVNVRALALYGLSEQGIPYWAFSVGHLRRYWDL